MKALNRSPFVSTATATLLAFASAGISAQTVTRPANPEPVATTQQKANEAMQKAIPQSNVGTVVRTGDTPSAAASAAVTPTPGVTTRTEATGTTDVTTDTGTNRTTRAPRADRG